MSVRSVGSCVVATVAMSVATGCGPSMPTVTPPPEGKGFQLVTPPVEVPEGEEQLWCSFFPALTEDFVLSKIEGHQSAGGHHAALFVADIPPRDPSKPVRCDGEDSAPEMTGWRYLGGGDAENAGYPMPGGVALKIPKGKSLMVQSHYVAGKGGVHARDIVNVTKWEGTGVPVLADFWAVGKITGLVVPPGESQETGDCEITEDISALYVLGHTHQYGNLFKLEVIRDGAPVPEIATPLYYQTNGPLMRVDPPRELFDVNTPLQLKKGDIVRYTCGWANDSGRELKWPLEMCQGLFMYYPSAGFKVCDDGAY